MSMIKSDIILRPIGTLITAYLRSPWLHDDKSRSAPQLIVEGGGKGDNGGGLLLAASAPFIAVGGGAAIDLTIIAALKAKLTISSSRDAEKKRYRPLFPDLAEALPFAADDPLSDGTRPFLALEWIGQEGTNYLGEVGNRSRGANATSADFAFRFRRYDGRIQLVLGEWKYTEYYASKEPSPKPTQLRVYRDAFERWKTSQPNLLEYRLFFVEPFYQLMRLTLLARAMEQARAEGAGEMEADVVSVLVVAPQANRDYMERFTVPAFARYGRTVGAAWVHLAPADRFMSLPTESLLTVIEQVAPEPSGRVARLPAHALRLVATGWRVMIARPRQQ